MSFTLKRIIWQDGKPSVRDDFEVMFEGKAVGRIYLRNTFHESWHWSIYDDQGPGRTGRRGDDGLADTLDEAKAEFKKAWDRQGPT